MIMVSFYNSNLYFVQDLSFKSYSVSLLIENNHFFMVVLRCLILLSLDVQTNPGPDESKFEYKNISVVNINVNSLRFKTDLIYNELGDHDIICITETKLNGTVNSTDLIIDNFHDPHAFRKDRQTDSGGGILFYIRNNLICKRRAELESPNVESMCVEVTANNNNKFLVVCIYRPPNSRVTSWNYIDSLLDNCIDTELNVILLGDFNIDLLKCSPDHPFSRTVEKFGLFNVVDEPTRITATSSTLLDPIFINNLDILRNTTVLPDFCSDHCPSVIEFNFRSLREKSYTKTIWDFKNADYQSIRNQLDLFDWNNKISDINNTNIINEIINEKITTCMINSIPQKTIRVRPKDKPWMNNRVRLGIRQRNRIHKKAKSSNNPEHWRKYREKRNEVITLTREAKNNYLSKLQNTLVDKSIPPRKWWRIAKSICQFKNKNTTSSPIKVNNNIYTHPKDKANALNDYFTSVSSNDFDINLPDLAPLSPCVLSDIIITEQDVADQFQILNINKPAGPDNLPPKFLKAIFQSLVTPITILFNKTIQLGQVPNDWKSANVSAIYKGKGDSDNPTNYRPISVTSCFGKILEKIIYKNLFNYIYHNKILSDNQSGFRTKDSTINQLLVIYNAIIKNLDIGKDVRFIFCDISKAFDRVWHQGLIFKLRKYGICGNVLKWIDSFLSGRKQRVNIEGYFSSWKTVNAGVPQGSTLGPFLFLLFINDIENEVLNNIKMFADDTSLYCVVDDHDTTADSLNQDLECMHQWSKDWGVTFNTAKTKSMLFTRRNNLNVPPLYLNGSILGDSDSHKHLGVTLMASGKWKDHISEIYSKSCKRINILRLVKYKLDRKSLERLYFGFIRPILEYGGIVWDNCSNEESDLLEKVQIEAARIITGLRKGTSHNKLYTELGWETLKVRRRKSKLILLHKSLNGETPEYLLDEILLHLNENMHYNLRNNRFFNLPSCRTSSYKNSFYPSVLDQWNQLDVDIQNLQSGAMFKKQISQEICVPPPSFEYGQRKLNILHCQLRNLASNLKHHLFLSHLSDSAQCGCGDDTEDNFHYFYVCPYFIQQRFALFSTLRRFTDILNIDTLLMGSSELSVDDNIEIVDAVHNFIHETKRFDF